MTTFTVEETTRLTQSTTPVLSGPHVQIHNKKKRVKKKINNGEKKITTNYKNSTFLGLLCFFIVFLFYYYYSLQTILSPSPLFPHLSEKACSCVYLALDCERMNIAETFM